MTKIDKPTLDTQISILTGDYRRLDGMIRQFNSNQVELDLGCGKGSYSSLLAEKFPERTIITADVMLGRLRRLVKRNIRKNINNIKVLRVEAKHHVACMLPNNSIDRLHILCPDPWPRFKHRHHRLVSSQFLWQIARILKPNGVFHFSTDEKIYFDSVCYTTDLSGLLIRDDSGIEDIIELKSDFELHWLEMGRSVSHGAWKLNPNIN